MKINNINVNYFTMGDEKSDEALVMLHGWGANIELFRNSAFHLRRPFFTLASDAGISLRLMVLPFPPRF